jgi:hypothetical protein
VANAIDHKNSNVKQGFRFADNRPVALKPKQQFVKIKDISDKPFQRAITEEGEILAVKNYYTEMLETFHVENNGYLKAFLDYTLKKNDSVLGAKIDLFDQVFLWALNSLSLKISQPTKFETAAELRYKDFRKFALENSIPEKLIDQLYEKARSDVKKDAVTGFDLAGDRIPTVDNAIKHLTENKMDRGFYVEVDIKNLGGLNAVKGHSGADAVYGVMAKIAETEMMKLEGLGNKVGRFRHGGDEFSFVMVGRMANKNMVDMAMTIAYQRINEYIISEKLDQIIHPKHPNDISKRGTGIVFGISEIMTTDKVENVLSRADLQVEAKKH